MSRETQAHHQQEGLQRGDILPLKSAFPRTQTRDISSASLYKNLQRSLSSSEHYFLANAALFRRGDSEYNKSLFDLFTNYVVVDKEMIPDNFLKLFNLDKNDPDLEESVLEIFTRMRMLNQKSARIIFVDDKIVIFRNDQQLAHTQEDNLTQGEKRRTNRKMQFNTFSNIYDAIRSQYYVVEGSQNNQDDCKLHQQNALLLAQELRVHGIAVVKDMSRRRQFDSLVSDIESSKNIRDLAALLQNLEKLTFKNPSIDANLLDGAKNKFRKRFLDLQAIVGVVSRDLNDLELILTLHQSALDSFLVKFPVNANYALSEYRSAYHKTQKKYGDISPFCQFHEWIEEHAQQQTGSTGALFARIDPLYTMYKHEHQSKLNGAGSSEFDGFSEIKDNLSLLKHL